MKFPSHSILLAKSCGLNAGALITARTSDGCSLHYFFPITVDMKSSALRLSGSCLMHFFLTIRNINFHLSLPRFFVGEENENFCYNSFFFFSVFIFLWGRSAFLLPFNLFISIFPPKTHFVATEWVSVSEEITFLVVLAVNILAS